jgi:hypothetical protein
MRALIFIWLLLAMPIPASADEYAIGDLAITYDPAHWMFAHTSAGDPLHARPAAFEARCVDCRGEAVVSISVGDIAREQSEAVLDPMWARDRSHTTMTVGGLTFGVTQINSPCRNYVPASMIARVAHRGRIYSFRSGVVVGCRNSYSVGPERFEGLLRGLHPRK